MKVTDSSSYGGGGGGGVDDELDCFGDPKAWPPGFRFHPTDEELVLYYLKRKICRRRLKLNVIKEIDVYKWEPEELPGQSILQSGDRQWYFFTPRDRKYPNGARSNRATRHGYWKATGKDRPITWNSRSVGLKKTLVFYRGRAPCGDRTDWVMHEYTMDEGELQRCQNVQDYFALYKVFKKSGPGPKNGEQYGAPFREEDWVDDEVENPVENFTTKEVSNFTPKEVSKVCENGSAFVGNLQNNQCRPPCEDLDELLRQFVDEPVRNQLPNMGLSRGVNISAMPASCYPRQNQCDTHGTEEETNCTRMGSTLWETTSGELVSWRHKNQSDAHGSFIATQSGGSHLLSGDAPEVTSASISSNLDFSGNFGLNYLEVDDLEGPLLPEGSNMSSVAAVNYPVEEIDGLYDSELFFDAAAFLQDTGTLEQSSISDPCIEYMQGDLSNQFADQTPITYVLDQNSTQLWAPQQRFNVSAPAENHGGTVPRTSASLGVSHVGSSTDLGEQRQNLDDNENEDIDTWFNSAISSFLGSIPARPALAAESVLINRAFQRMSSFGRVKIAAAGAATGGRAVAVAERRVCRNRGLLFAAALGVICAVLWMIMIGMTLKILKNVSGRFL